MSPTEAPKPKRRYDSTRRARQAAQTRQDVVDAAIELFSTAGWAGTTLTALAARAGVAVETVYAGFGSKKNVLRAAMEAAVVGDVEPIPFAEREAFARLGRGPREARVRAAAALATDIHERSAGVWRALVEAASGDGEVEAWRTELERGRRLDVGRSFELVFGTELDSGLVDLLWALMGPEVWFKLVHDAGWSREDYERYLYDAIVRLVGPVRRRRTRSA